MSDGCSDFSYNLWGVVGFGNCLGGTGNRQECSLSWPSHGALPLEWIPEKGVVSLQGQLSRGGGMGIKNMVHPDVALFGWSSNGNHMILAFAHHPFKSYSLFSFFGRGVFFSSIYQKEKEIGFLIFFIISLFNLFICSSTRVVATELG